MLTGTTATDAGHAPQLSKRPRTEAADAAQQLQDLTFVNMTDPQQSKSRESRKVVRRQVMVNFAREKRRQQKPSSPGSAQAGISNSNTISGVQELLNAAMPTAEGTRIIDWSLERGAPGLDSASRHDVLDPPTRVATAPSRRAGHSVQRRKSGTQLPAMRLSRNTVSRASKLPRWPVAPEAHVQGLLNHCKIGPLPCPPPVFCHTNAQLHLGYSVLFRACHPQYMISLLANRPSAETYPFYVDIDSVEDLDLDYGVNNAVQSELY